MAVDQAKVTRYVDKHAQLRESYLLALLKALLGLWGGFDGWGNPDLVSAQVAKSAALVDVSLSRTRLLARSYALQLMKDMGANPEQLQRQRNLYPRSGTTLTEAYTRPVKQYYYAKSKGLTDKEAFEKLTERLEDLATMDIAAAERDELMDTFSSSKKITGYRRVIHPERSRSGTCGLCVVASTRIYSFDDLMALHDNCKCTVMAVSKSDDPGLKLNDDDLQAIYAAAGSTAAADLKRTRIAFLENGELGQMLVRDGQHFRDVTEVNRNGRGRKYEAYKKPTYAEQAPTWTAQRDSSRRAIERLKAAQKAGTNNVDLGTGKATSVKNITAAIKYHQDLIDRMNQKLSAR